MADFTVDIEDQAVLDSDQDLKVGDLVKFTNDFGVVFYQRVLGFAKPENIAYERSIHLDTDCYWFPVKRSSLEKMDKLIPPTNFEARQIEVRYTHKNGNGKDFTEKMEWAIWDLTVHAWVTFSSDTLSLWRSQEIAQAVFRDGLYPGFGICRDYFVIMR